MEYTNSELITDIILIEGNCRSHSSLRGMLKDAVDNPELVREEADKIRFSYKLLDALVIVCYNKIKELYNTNESFVVARYHDPYWKGKVKWKIRLSGSGGFEIVDEYDSEYYSHWDDSKNNVPFIISRIRSSLQKELKFYYYNTLEKFLNDKDITEEVREMLNSEEKIDAVIMLKELIS